MIDEVYYSQDEKGAISYQFPMSWDEHDFLCLWEQVMYELSIRGKIKLEDVSFCEHTGRCGCHIVWPTGKRRGHGKSMRLKRKPSRAYLVRALRDSREIPKLMNDLEHLDPTVGTDSWKRVKRVFEALGLMSDADIDDFANFILTH